MSVRKAKYGSSIALALVLASCASTEPTANSLLGQSADAKAETGDNNGATSIEAALKQAQAMRTDGDLQGASQVLAQLVLVAPDDPHVLGEYGKVLVARGRADDALAFLRRAAQLQPNDWTLYSALGVAYDQKADYRTAKMAYDRALALNPGDPGVLSNAALSRMLAGDLVSADQMLSEAAAKDKDNEKIKKNLALVQSLEASQGTRIAKAAPPKAPAVKVAAVQPAAAPKPALQSPILTVPAAATEAPKPIAKLQPMTLANAAPPKSPRSYEALKNDPTVRMAPIPVEQPALSATHKSSVASTTPRHVTTAIAPPAPPATKVVAHATPTPAAPAVTQKTLERAPHVLPPAPVEQAASANTQAKQTAIAATKPESNAKPGAAVSANAKSAGTPAKSETKSAMQTKSAPVAASGSPQTLAKTVAAAPRKPAVTAKDVIVIKGKGKPKQQPLETAMLRPTVTDVTSEGATAHKNTPPKSE